MNHSLEDDNKDLKNASKEQNPSAGRQDKYKPITQSVYLCTLSLLGMPLENTQTSYKGMENMVPQGFFLLFVFNKSPLDTNQLNCTHGTTLEKKYLCGSKESLFIH